MRNRVIYLGRLIECTSHEQAGVGGLDHQACGALSRDLFLRSGIQLVAVHLLACVYERR